MKKSLLIILSLLLGMVYMPAIAQEKPLSPKEERREEREKRRAERIAEQEKHLDSVVLSRYFKFTPNSMQRQPAGSMRYFSNPMFYVSMWGEDADVCLPYITGVLPPYRVNILNYTVSDIKEITMEKKEGGWTITFTTTLFSSSIYTFVFEISTQTGHAMLTISNPIANTVEYSGTISQIY